jgi:fatty acid synthase subunit alpha
LPDRPEDASLLELDGTLGEVSLGETSSAILQRIFTAKMPARTTVATVRNRLAVVWGLPTQRQTAVLLGALAAEPQARLPSHEAADQYWDGMTEVYGQAVGLVLQRRAAREPPAEHDPMVASKDTLGAKTLARKQYQALRQYLKVPSPSVETDALAMEQQQQLDRWTAEFSSEFLDRISPCFDARKARWYRDWWNAARQELLAVCALGQDPARSPELRDRLCRRADPSLIQVAQSNPFGQSLAPALQHGLETPPVVRLGESLTMAPRTVVTPNGEVECHESPRKPARFAEFFTQWTHKKGAVHSEGRDLNPLMLESLLLASKDGVTFARQTYLLTGAGPGSIGGYIARLLLAGGACLIVTTSRQPSNAAAYFKRLYEDYGSRGSSLYLLPFNQASVVDCERLVDYVYHELDTDLDAILPFAATSQTGAGVDRLNANNEFAMRLMLVNVLRLLGFVVGKKRRRGIRCKTTQVVLPLSPNHGILGGDGLYAESKRGLETVMSRFHSESWDDALSICGVSIGWTRSTSLMASNDEVAETAEQQGGVLTFSGEEMGSLVVLLLSSPWSALCEDEPILADFSGGLGAWNDASAQLAAARAAIDERANISRAIFQEDERESGGRLEPPGPEAPLQPRTSLHIGFPRLLDYDKDVQLMQHKPAADVVPEDAVVVVGFAELGPWGSARMRWEMECHGQLSSAGYVEMAWLMNLIRHVDGHGAHGNYVGWIDVESGEPVGDTVIPQQYGEIIRSRSGIRALPSENREILQEIVLDEELPAFETTQANAEALRQRHGSHLVMIIRAGDSNDPSSTCQVQLQRGAAIRVPKTGMAIPVVAGPLPTGWSPEKYGIPADIVQQVEPVTLAVLCCVAEAFYSAGMPDPMEIFERVHVSELGNYIGSSMGGVINTRALYHDGYVDQEVASHALQETYVNTAPAWVNMLLLGAAGPIKTPVGACATALESVDSGAESIRAGRTKVCVVGGYDDMQPEERIGFAHMKATASVPDEQARGRMPSEMSRPMAWSRAGFIESQGCGVQLLCRGDVALAMGLPVYGIVAGSSMAGDGISRSVPAPGQGILTFAREDSETISPLRSALARWGLDIDDLTVASLHGTSTPANDTNESAVIQREMTHLGRTPGRPLWAICQKSITGHSKAPAAAWMLNGCLQVMESRLVAGNRNADDVDPDLRAFDHLCFPTRPVQTAGVPAFLLNSCGFGQKEGQMVGVHPRYFFSLLSRAEFQGYRDRMQHRTERAEQAYVHALMTNQIVRVQSRPAYGHTKKESVLLNPAARIYSDPATGSYRVSAPEPPGATERGKQDAAIGIPLPSRHGCSSTVGVDMVTLSSFTAHENAYFLQRNYTDRERKFLQTRQDFRAAAASTWCAKEAVFKCLQTVSKGAGAAMKEVEIVRCMGAPSVVVRCYPAGHWPPLTDM